MEIEIVSRKENKVLEREELYFKIKYEGKTPSRRKVRDNLKNMVGGKVVIIEYIKPVYGISEADGYARIYQSENKAREVEAEHIIDRNLKKGGEEAAEKAEEKKEEAKDGKEEKPAEEAKAEGGAKAEESPQETASQPPDKGGGGGEGGKDVKENVKEAKAEGE